jgi:hypothetical protein
VNDIHTNGTQIAALERSRLKGAAPDTTHSVVLQISQPARSTRRTASWSSSAADRLYFEPHDFVNMEEESR